MKIIHVSDLHLGLRLHKFDLHEEQKDMLDQIANLAQSEKAGALIIAGDVFHTAMPDSESIDRLDDFLTKMAAMQVPVVMIAGNHDSASRVAYGGRLMERQGIHVAGRYKGSVPFVDIEN
jgi:exonuclease SbcD